VRLLLLLGQKKGRGEKIPDTKAKRVRRTGKLKLRAPGVFVFFFALRMMFPYFFSHKCYRFVWRGT
jgi:hypothetical protein